MNIFPHIILSTQELHDGSLFTQHDFCSKKLQNDKWCQAHYSNIFGKCGFHECPYGFTSYVTNEQTILSSLRIEQHYDKRKIKNQTAKFPARMPPDYFLKYLSRTEESTNSDKLEDITNSLHDIRKFCGSINRKAYNALCETSQDTAFMATYNMTHKCIYDIHIMGKLLSLNLSAIDSTLNPRLKASADTKIPVSIYNKFKTVKLFLGTELRKKNISMEFTGASYASYEIAQHLDLLPYLIFENAIKYSPAQKNIYVNFSESAQEVKVSISSIGPFVEDDEVDKLTFPKFRGKNTSAVTGEGRGLFIAASLCRESGVILKINPSRHIQLTLNGLPMANFTVDIVFPRN